MQIRGLHKSKQIFFLVAKFLIIAAALFFLFQTLNELSYTEFLFIKSAFLSSENGLLFILFLLFISTINWILEIEKWRLLANEITQVSFKNAVKQSLVAFTSSIMTPAKAGDFISKTLFFPSKYRARVIWLNTINNGTQLVATVLFGSMGLMVLIFVFPEVQTLVNRFNLVLLLSSLAVFIVAGIVLWKYVLKNRFQNFIKATLKISQTTVTKVQLLSILKYLVFSFQFYVLLDYFGIHLSYGLSMSLISSLYLLNSLLPTSALFDTITKGGLAVFLFGMAGVEPLAILMVIFVMWVFNYVFPALIGIYYLLPFKASKIMSEC